MRELFNYLTLRGKEKNLNFSSWEFLTNVLIGLDGIGRKLLIIKGTKDRKYDEDVINLDEVKSCSIKKVYGSIKAGDLKKRKLAQLLDRISLYLEFYGGKKSVEIQFFEFSENDGSNRSELEQKAAQWRGLISRAINEPGKTIAAL